MVVYVELVLMNLIVCSSCGTFVWFCRDLIWGALDENGHPHHNALPALTYEDFVCGVCPSLDPELPLAGQLAQRYVGRN